MGRREIKRKVKLMTEDLKEEEKDRIKNLKVKIKWIQKPTKQDFDDRDIIYKDEMLAEEE